MNKTKRTRKKKQGKIYFTKETEESIIKYNSLDDSDPIKEPLFNEKIKPALDKLVENIFNTFKFSYMGVEPKSVQEQTVSFLVSNLHKFNSEKGKAFSYFSIVAKNYLIHGNNSNYKQQKTHSDIKTMCETTFSVDCQIGEINLKDFFGMMTDFWFNSIPTLFDKESDKKIAYALTEVFRNSDYIDNYNKKAIYLYIREMTDCKTNHITKVIKRMKDIQKKMYKHYIEHGDLTNFQLK